MFLESKFSSPLEMFALCVCVHKVLDGSESQYSGMQIGTLQDEEDEGAAPSSQEDPPEPFLQSALGTFVHTHTKTETLVCTEDMFCLLIGILDCAHCLFLCAALSKPHLFEGRGHNRQGSDSSVDRFILKDEPAEPEPDNKVKTYPHKTCMPVFHTRR